MIKLKEIAEKLGMGVSTVSAVLNEKDYCYVSEEKKKLIKDTAKAMGYVPNRMSRGMKGLPTQTIGIIGKWLFLSPVLSRLIDFINLDLTDMGYSVLLSDSRPGKDLKPILNEFTSRGVDGVLVQGGIESELGEFLEHNNIPYVTINEEYDGFSVTVDRTAGVFEAVEHLIFKHNRCKIGFLCRDFTASKLKFAGYRAALEKYDLAPYTIEIPEPARDIKMASTKVKELKLDAVFATNDILAGLLLKDLQKAGMLVPHDVSLIGFDGIDYLCEMTNPTLTSVFHPVKEVAEKAVDVLLKQIKKESIEKKIYYIKPALSIGESCGCSRKEKI